MTFKIWNINEFCLYLSLRLIMSSTYMLDMAHVLTNYNGTTNTNVFIHVQVFDVYKGFFQTIQESQA